MKLSGESAVEKITLDGVRGLRVTLSATVHDVLYYMSPIYCQDIIDSVCLLIFFECMSTALNLYLIIHKMVAQGRVLLNSCKKYLVILLSNMGY